MSKRRLDKLEGSLSPKEAVIHWLSAARAFGSLPAYAESLIGQPETSNPFIAIPSQVEKAVYESMRGQRSGLIKEVMREAVGDTIFLLRLVLALNLEVEETLRSERLRHAALYWWSRALDPDRRGKKDLPPEWRAGVAIFHGVLLGTEQARASAEARYLDGHGCLFPEPAAAWRDLLEAAEHLSGGSSPNEDAIDGAEQAVQRVVYMARADGLDASEQQVAADAMAKRMLHLQGMDAPGGSDG